jgi:hypothetical protein
MKKLRAKRLGISLTSDVVASRNTVLSPPSEWVGTFRHLSELSRSPAPAPSWWTPKTAYFGNVETCTDPSTFHWDGMKRLGRRDPPLLICQITMAG